MGRRLRAPLVEILLRRPLPRRPQAEPLPGARHLHQAQDDSLRHRPDHPQTRRALALERHRRRMARPGLPQLRHSRRRLGRTRRDRIRIDGDRRQRLRPLHHRTRPRRRAALRRLRPIYTRTGDIRLQRRQSQQQLPRRHDLQDLLPLHKRQRRRTLHDGQLHRRVSRSRRNLGPRRQPNRRRLAQVDCRRQQEHRQHLAKFPRLLGRRPARRVV